MKVRELQQQLNKLDPDLEVLCYSEDEILQSKGQVFRIFNIEAVDATHAERVRLQDNTPSLKLGKGPNSEVLATLEITLDF
jgi:hypothetical protein